MKSRLLTCMVVFALMLGLSACSTSPKIQYDAVMGYDFSKAQTYAISDSKGSAQVEVGPGSIQAVHQAMRAGLEAAGLKEAPAEDADLLVVAHLQMTDKTEINDPLRGYGGLYGFAPGGDVTTTEYKDTTLSIDVVDNVKDTLVWRGWASKDIHGDTKGALDEKGRESLETTITSIMANFPPPSGGAKG